MQLNTVKNRTLARMRSRAATRGARRPPRVAPVVAQAPGKRSPMLRIEAKAAWCSGKYASLAPLAAQLGVSADTLRRWRKEDEWGSAARDLQNRATELAVVELGDDLEAMKKRHLRHALRLQDKGMTELEGIGSESVSEARQLVESGIKIERQAMGADDLSGALEDGLLSGEVIAVALERQRVMLIKKPTEESKP